MNVLDHIKEEHKEVEELFEQAEEKPTLAVIKQISEKVLPHHYAEEHTVFPTVKAKTEQKKEVVNALMAEHDIMHLQLRELLAMKESDDLFKAKFGVLKELFTHHVTEEEEVFFKHAEEVYSESQLKAADKQFEKAHDGYSADNPDEKQEYGYAVTANAKKEPKPAGKKKEPVANSLKEIKKDYGKKTTKPGKM